MKVLTLLAAIAGMLFISCNKKSAKLVTMDERAADSVSSYVKAHLDDPSSYQPGTFGKLEKNYSTYESDDNYYTYSNWVGRAKEKRDQQDSAVVYKQRKQSGFYDKLYQKGLKKMDSLKANYKPAMLGYKITHQYKAKDGSHDVTFKLDTALSVLKADEKK